GRARLAGRSARAVRCLGRPGRASRSAPPAARPRLGSLLRSGVIEEALQPGAGRLRPAPSRDPREGADATKAEGDHRREASLPILRPPSQAEHRLSQGARASARVTSFPERRDWSVGYRMTPPGFQWPPYDRSRVAVAGWLIRSLHRASRRIFRSP